MTISLQDVEVDPADPRLLKWKIETRWELREPVVLVVRTLRNGRVTDIQQLGASWEERGLPADAVDAIASRLSEELVRIKLAAALSDSSEWRAAA
jgi:hypothetical protein